MVTGGRVFVGDEVVRVEHLCNALASICAPQWHRHSVHQPLLTIAFPALVLHLAWRTS